MEGVRSTRAWRFASAAVLATAIVAGASAARGAVSIEGLQERLPDLDVRTASIEPTAAQTAAAARVGASVSWNRAEVLITLNGRQSFRVIKVSALLGPGQNRFTALRSFEVLACDQTSGKACDPATPGDWTSVLVSQPNTFPSVNPRPIAPDLIMRAWKVPKVNATHVLFRVRTNQCSGQASYQGEQDNDPQYSTDCRVTSLTSTGTVALPRRDTDVRAAEVELVSAPPRVQGGVVESLGDDD